MVHPLVGISIVLLALGASLGGLAIYRHRAAPHPELVRKLLHVGAGVASLTYPWLFDAIWPVLILAAAGIALLACLRHLALRQTSVGQVLGGVSRFSFGELYFPLAVSILWILYICGTPDPLGRRLLLYLIPLLLLTLSDASAALVGVAYGRWQYATAEGPKSLEGSFTFFLSSFMCVHIPLLVASDRGRVETLLIAVLLAWLATMFEAIAWSGLDNLVLPLISYLLLVLYWELPVAALLTRLAVTAAVFVFVLIYAPRTTLAGNALLGAFLVAYICWALGGWRWLMAPMLVFVFHTWLWPSSGEAPEKIHNIHAVASVSSGGLAWLFLSRLLQREECFYPFNVAFAAHLAIFGLAQLRFEYPASAPCRLLLIAVGKSWVLLFPAYVLIQLGSWSALLEAGLALLPIAVAVCGFNWTQPQMHSCPLDPPRWLRQGAWAGAASLLAVAPHLFRF